jgi:hypothetical protein
MIGLQTSSKIELLEHESDVSNHVALLMSHFSQLKKKRNSISNELLEYVDNAASTMDVPREIEKFKSLLKDAFPEHKDTQEILPNLEAKLHRLKYLEDQILRKQEQAERLRQENDVLEKQLQNKRARKSLRLLKEQARELVNDENTWLEVEEFATKAIRRLENDQRDWFRQNSSFH